jgi:hypothetical protein
MKIKIFIPVLLFFIITTSFSVPGKDHSSVSAGAGATPAHKAVKPPPGYYVGWCTAVWEDVAVDFDVYVDFSTGEVVSAVRIYDNQVFGASGTYSTPHGSRYVTAFNAAVGGNLYWYTGPLDY